MRWPWERKMRATDRGITKDVLEPAMQEVDRAKIHLDRIRRILREAEQAEKLIAEKKRR